MGKAVICKGDGTSHGGVVIEGHAIATIDGRQIACIGHKTFCPLCEGTYPIIEGAATHFFMDLNTAVDGMRTACGASLVASQFAVTVE
jgi:uncharacterized Zn-binding protein involved in type VI secretion